MRPAGFQDRLLTIAEVAAILRVTTRTVYNWARRGILRPVRLPGRPRAIGYLESEIRSLLAAGG